MTQTALYRHYDGAGRLLYVGISLSAVQRLAQHAGSAWSKDIRRVEVETFPDRKAALCAEREAIRAERPLHNKTYAAARAFETTGAWRTALAKAIEVDGRSMREVSIDAGLAHGYVHSIIKEGKDPSVGNLMRLARVLGIPVSAFFRAEQAGSAA